MAAPLLALNLGYDEAAVGLLLALFALPQIFVALPAGRWADRKGVRTPVASAVLVAAVGAGVAAAFPVYPVLCIAALLSGGGMAVGAISLQRHVGRATTSSANRKRAFAWLSTAPALSNFVGPFATGLIIDHAGYRAAFLVLGALSVSAWGWLHAVRDLPADPTYAKPTGNAWDLWKEPQFRRLLALNWFMAASFDVHGFVVPVLGHERGLPASVIGTILGCFAVAATVVRIAMPVMAARVREWILITAAMALTATFFFLYPFAESAVAMAICSTAIGLSFGSVQPMVMTLLHHVTPPNRHGEAVAMRHLMINASSVTMPVLFGVAGGVMGVSSLFWLMSAVVAMGSRVSVGLRHVTDGHDS